MKVPRLRLSVRSVMIAVAICALMLGLAPICERTIWTWVVIRDVRRGESTRYSKIGYERAGPRAVDALRVALHSDQTKTRAAAARSLGMIGSEAEATVLALIDTALHDQNSAVRIDAICSLGEIGPGARQAVEPVLGLIQHGEDPHIVYEAIQALGRIGPGARAAMPLLASMVKDPRHNSWMLAAQALGRMGPEGRAEASVAIPSLIELLEKGQTPGERRYAAEVLANMGPDADSAVPALTAAMRDPELEVRRAAGKALKVLDSSPTPKELAEPGRPRPP